MTAGRATVAAVVALALAVALGFALHGAGDAGPDAPPAVVERPAAAPPPSAVVPAPALAGRPAGTAPTPAPAAPAAPATETGTGTVVVLVRDEKEAPFPKASVTVATNVGARVGPLDTGADGVATFSPVPAGDVWAHAAAPGFETSSSVGHVRAGETARVTVTMRALVPVTGHVRLPDGTGVAATVTVVRGGTFGGRTDTCGGAWCKVATTTSAADGAFRVEVPGDAILTLRATAPGWAAGEAAIRRSAPGEEVVLVLRPGGTVRGAVRAPDGRPCAGARLWLVPADEPAFLENPRYVIGADGSRSWSSGDGGDDGGFMGSTSGGSTASGVTKAAVRAVAGADGAFEFDGLAVPAVYRVLAEGCGGARGVSADAALSEAARRATADVPLTPRSVLKVRGETPDGRPDPQPRGMTLVGAREHFLDARGGRWSLEGIYGGVGTFEGLLPGRYELLVEMEDSVPVSRAVEVPAGETVEIAVRGIPGRTLSGVVKDRTGKAVAGAKVRISVPASAGVLAQDAQATTDEAGAFTLRGLQDAAGKVTVEAEGFTALEPVEARPQAEPLVVVLRRGAEIRGRLVVPAGASMPGDAWVAQAQRDEPTIEGNVKFGADGSFRMPVDRLDVARTYLMRPRVGAWVLLGTFALASEEVRDLGPVTVDEGRVVRGRVTDEAGTPLGAVTVWVDPRGMPGLADGEMVPRLQAASDASGRFAIRGVMRADVVLRTEHAPHAPAAVVAKDDRETEVALRPGAFITGRLLDAAGSPVTEGAVWWVGASPDALATFAGVDAKGAFAIGPVAAGAFTLEVYAGKRVPVATGTLAEGERRTVEVRKP